MKTPRNTMLVRALLGAPLVCVLVLVSALPPQSALALGTVRFAKAGGAVSGACTSWLNACELRYVLASVAASGNQIWVKAGTYKPTATADRTKSFNLKEGVAVYGGFAGTETLLSQRNPAVNVTILSGEINEPVVIDNSYHVVVASLLTNTAVLDGFRIEYGYATGASGSWESYGAGLLNQSSDAMLRNLTFSGGWAFVGGGGMSTTGNPALTNVVFTGNSAGYGGGLYVADGQPTITNVKFVTNSATNLGGGMASHAGTAKLVNVSFINNSAGGGGGMFNDSTASPKLTNVTFSGNSSTSYGAAIYNNFSSPTLTNVTFSANTTGSNGAGIYNESSSPLLTHVTFKGNSAGSGGAMFNNNSSAPSIYNSILSGDSGAEIVNVSSSPTIAYSIVAGGCPSGGSCTRVISLNPVLGPLRGNGGFTKTMALGAGSPAIDRGSSTHCASKDQRGVPRPQGPACDMGAYEVRALTFTSTAAYDGWVLEASETGGVGGSLNSTAATVRVGDDAARRQYRSLLSFNTTGVPDAATIVLAKLKARSQTLVGINPFSTHGNLVADLRRPYFGSALALGAADFQAAATVISAGIFSPTPLGGWYTASLNSSGRTYINKLGTTQFRLRFSLDDDNDSLADYVAFFSSNNTVSPAYNPRIIVYYNP